jgi:hypothetical protein
MYKLLLFVPLLVILVLVSCDNNGEKKEANFTVKVEVLGGSVTPIAPLAWAVHTGDNPFFVPNTTARINGLEVLAEDGDPSTADSSLSNLSAVVGHGIANTPDGSGAPGPATPGNSYSFSFVAMEGEILSFATMYVQSNDLFFSPGTAGVALFSNGNAISGDITAMMNLYDAGTEVNEQPGVGPNQAPRQPAPNTGPDENGTVRLISDVNDGFTYPAVNQVIKVTISSS